MLLKILFPSPFAWTSPAQPRTLSENLTSGRVGTPPKAPLPIWRPQNVQKSVCLSAQQEHSDLHNRRPTMKKMFDDDGRCAIIILLWWSPPQPGRVAVEFNRTWGLLAFCGKQVLLDDNILKSQRRPCTHISPGVGSELNLDGECFHSLYIFRSSSSSCCPPPLLAATTTAKEEEELGTRPIVIKSWKTVLANECENICSTRRNEL